MQALISMSKHRAAHVLKARVLLKVEVSEVGEGLSTGHIVKALDTSEATVIRTRQAAGRGGFRGWLRQN